MKKNTGFSLAEALIAMGISSVAALLVYKVMEESTKNTKTVENRDEIAQFTRELTGRFGDRAACTNTLGPLFTQEVKTMMVSKVMDKENNVVFAIPFKRGSVTLETLKIENLDREKGTAEVRVHYKHKVQKQEFGIDRKFSLELDMEDKKTFIACVATGGVLNIDPKEACEAILGFDNDGNNYFYNANCDFPRAACEKSGRLWNPAAQTCEMAPEEKKVVRQEVCGALGFIYNESKNTCDLTAEQIENYKKSMMPQMPAMPPQAPVTAPASLPPTFPTMNFPEIEIEEVEIPE